MIITIDTGGTKTLVAGFSREGQPGVEHRFPTPKNQDEYIATLGELLHDEYISKKRDIDAVVIAIPGTINNKGVAVWCQNLGWENFDVVRKLKNIIDAPIFVENDANLAGLAETLTLRKQPRNSLYVTISTGIGTGVIADGQIDPNMSMSEGGKAMLEYDGILRRWEEFGSGKSIYETYGKFARDIHDKRIWKQIADKMSRGFLVLIPTIMPDVIIIGGSIGTYFDRYAAVLEKHIREHLEEHIPMPEFRQAAHPEEAVIYGCYYYGKQKLGW